MINKTYISVLAISLALSSFSMQTSFASSSSETLPSHTLVLLSVDEDLNSGGTPVGTDVKYVVDKDVLGADGNVLIAAGAPGLGKVITSYSAGGFGKNGKLEISCESVTAIDGTQIKFDDPEFKNQGGGTRMRALIRPLLLMPFSKGGDVHIQQGLPITMQTDMDYSVKPTSTPPNPSDVQVLPTGHNQKMFSASIASFTQDEIIFQLQSGEKDMKLADVNKILLGS